MSLDTFQVRTPLTVAGTRYEIFSLRKAGAALGGDIGRMPVSLAILLENLLRHEDGESVTRDDIERLARWTPAASGHEIAYYPVRVLMPDSSGIPLLADLAAMRDALAERGHDPAKVNPLCPVDLVVDHSVTAEYAGTPEAYAKNIALEFRLNRERYAFARWAQATLTNFRIIPPGAGIVHQVNLEHLSRPVWSAEESGVLRAYPDTLVGMDSHTPMINALGVLGWGVGGIEAASAMLGEPISMLIPEVVGCRVHGRLRPGVTCTDVALTLTERLRRHGVVGKLVEFFGPGLSSLGLPDRATLANMAPEYGATMGFFPLDDEALRFLRLTGRDERDVALAEAYAKEQGLWARADGVTRYAQVVELDLSAVEPSVSGPKRPQDRHALSAVPASFAEGVRPAAPPAPSDERPLQDGDVVIAAITSCTNTSNPSAMIAAGLLARNAARKGLRRKPWVKASLSPGSRVVSDYLEKAGLQAHLDALGFHLAGYGCMTCAGGSGSLAPEVTQAVETGKLAVCAVLSANRNFEGRTHPLVAAAYLASPPLVVAYALAGNVLVDLSREPLGKGADGAPVFLRDIWPSDEEVAATVGRTLDRAIFTARYAAVTDGEANWKAIPAAEGAVFRWNPHSSHLRRPPYLDPDWVAARPRADIRSARIVVMLGDSVTTDHIAPMGQIPPKGPAAEYLEALGIPPRQFETYLNRRANHEVMVRGAFANTRLRNEICPGVVGGFTRHFPDGEVMTIYEAATRYAAENVPVVVVAGKEYGAGSSRDWAAKGPALLGVRAIIAESFERIHRSNLVGMGVLPLQFPEGVTRRTLGLDGSELIDLEGIGAAPSPGGTIRCSFRRADGTATTIELRCRLDTRREAAWFAAGGILNYVLAKLCAT